LAGQISFDAKQLHDDAEQQHHREVGYQEQYDT